MFFVVSLLVSVGLLAVVHVWATRSFRWLGRHKRAVAGSLVGLLALQAVTRWTEIRWHFGAPIHTACIGLVMTIVIAAVPLALMQLVSRGIGLLRRRASGRDPSPRALSRRQVIEATGGLALFGASGSMMGWGIVRGRYAFELREVAVRVAGLPRALDGYVIVQASDLHTGLYVGERELDEGLSLVRAARGDLLVVTGDLVDLEPRYAPLAARKLMDLAPRDGVYACLGNHDYYAGARKVLACVRAAGIVPLVDDGRVIRAGDAGGFALLGVDDKWSEKYGRSGPRIDLAISKVPPGLPRVLLSHQPPTVEKWAGRVALQLSGHTHGGQINPLGLRPADLFYRYLAGRYEVRGTTLYVNSGLGTVGPPARVWAPPEITRIVLVAA